MHSRTAWITAAAIVVASAAGAFAAQSFEQSVGQALSQESPILLQSSELKQSLQSRPAPADDSAVQDEDYQEEADGFRPGPGGHGGGGMPSPRIPSPRPSPRPPMPRPPEGGHRPPTTHPPTTHPPTTHPPTGGRTPNPGHGRPPVHIPGHRQPRPGGGDWGRWHHPGWGHHHDGRWDWRDGYPHWWGWLVWRGVERDQCLAYYDGLRGQCNDTCEIEDGDCVQACDGDGDCQAQCAADSSACYDTCLVDYDERVQTCPW